MQAGLGPVHLRLSVGTTTAIGRIILVVVSRRIPAPDAETVARIIWSPGMAFETEDRAERFRYADVRLRTGVLVAGMAVIPFENW